MKDLARYPDAVYIGRPSKWGNEFVIGRDGTRTDVLEKHKKRVMADPEFQEEIRRELKGKTLVCYCAPKRCHGDLYLAVANQRTLFSSLVHTSK